MINLGVYLYFVISSRQKNTQEPAREMATVE